MTKAKNHIPQGLTSVTPQLVPKNGRAMLEFLKKAFGATVGGEMVGPDGKITHAHALIGGSCIFISDASGFAQPTQSNVFLYVENVDAAMASAERAGAKILAPAKDMFWGDRWGMLTDHEGNHWQIATHLEDVPPEEMQRRMMAAQKG
jgi:uncharacterized glyoxalase superfamily protein PhnB